MGNTRKENIPQSYETALGKLVINRLRIVGIVGAVLILLFSRLDVIVYPSLWLDFLYIRFAICAIFIFLMALSFHRKAGRASLLLGDAMVLTAGLGISLMIYLSDGSASEYYEGLNLVFLGMFTINSFRPWHHIPTGAVIIFAYIAAATASPSPFLPEQFSSALFFMVSTLIFVTLTADLYGRQHFEQFLKSEEIAAKNEAIEEAYQKLRKTEKLKDEFFANMSHELRTPLTLILGPLESLIAESAKMDAQARYLLGVFHHHAIRLLQMINGLLDFSKLEAGKVDVKRQVLGIVSTTSAVIEDFRPAAEQKGLTLDFQGPETEAFVQMDRYIYDRILFNLLSNAVKFTEKGGITVRMAAADEKVTVTVEDTGIGISENEIPGLFEKFRQLKGSSTRRFEGTGLGLALVKEFVTLLEGTVSVSSRTGKGSAFTVSFPAPPASEREAAKSEDEKQGLYRKFLSAVPVRTAPARSPAQKTVSPKRGKILVAEDNEELASYIASLLEPSMELRFAKNGREALEKAAEWLPDIILADIMMPEMDGLALCREVKKNPSVRHIPVVLLTALTHREALLQGWEAGADEYLFKPFHPTELVTRINSILGSIALRRDIEKQLMKQTEESTRLKTEMEQLELFSYIASHDLQEPLATLLNLSSFLRETGKGSLPPEQERCVYEIEASAKRMQQYVEDVLKYAKVGAGNADDFQLVDLNGTLEMVLENLAGKIAAADGRIEKDRLPSVQSDPVQMEQLFKNLIGNAVKYRRPETALEIKVRYVPRDTAHTLVFEDNGTGFDPKYTSEIFRPFFRAGKTDAEGSGIGLAICQKIVRRHGGNIIARSAPGKGTTFEVHLPKDPSLPWRLQVPV